MKKLFLLSLFFSLNINAFTFLGYTLNNPVGLSACTLGQSKTIAELAKKGCSILTYRSIRSKPATRHPGPNIGYITQTKPLTRSSLASGLSASTDYTEMKPISLANSYGIESADQLEVIKDIQAARASLGDNQILIVSIYPQAYPGISRAQDAHHLALTVKEAGAQAVEINLACPNTYEQPLYEDLEKLEAICKAAVAGANELPVLIKIGYISDIQKLTDVVTTAIKAGVRGITSMNSIAAEILDVTNGKHYFPNRPMAGVSGNIIRELALEQIKALAQIRTTHNLDFDIAGVGGITEPAHFNLFLESGANVALSATGLLHNHNLVQEYLTV